MKLRTALTLFSATFLLAGCALISKVDPVFPQYYSPEAALGLDRGPSAGSEANAKLELRLRRVQSAEHLRDYILYRKSDWEFGYEEEHRWTELPESYLQRALAHVLFEEAGFKRNVGGSGATLEAELASFEIVTGPQRKARVKIVILLQEQNRAHFQQSFSAERALVSDAPEAAAKALGEALRDVIEQSVARVEKALRAKG